MDYLQRFEHNFDNAIMGAVGGFVFFIMVADFSNFQVNNLLLRAIFAVLTSAVMIGIYSFFGKGPR